MPTPGRSTLPGMNSGVLIQTPDLAANIRGRRTHASLPTQTTTGATEVNLVIPLAGTITQIRIAYKDALAASDTLYVTYTVTNKGQAGAGSTALVAATDANTTKLTGGAALVAYGARDLVLHGTAANLVVADGDIINFVTTPTGTLPNTLTVGTVSIKITPS